MIVVRKLMEFMFTPRHLHYLDDPMPPLCGKKDDSADVESISSASSNNELNQDRRLSVRYSHLLETSTPEEKKIPLLIKDKNDDVDDDDGAHIKNH